MENVKINITGDVHIHIHLDPDDYFEDDEFEEDGEYEEDEEGDDDNNHGFSVAVGGLPEDIDHDAVRAVIETACDILDGLIEKAAVSRKDDPHERV